MTISTRFVALLAVGLCLWGLSPSAAQELKRISLDDPSALGLRIAADPAVKVEGKASVRIETAWPTTICLASVDGLDVEGAALIFKARIKTELEGQAVLEMWVSVGGKRYFSRALDKPVEGRSDWRPVETPFFAKKGQRIDKAWLNVVINGQGTVWVDDASLLRGALPSK